jgi:hypothetical protein
MLSQENLIFSADKVVEFLRKQLPPGQDIPAWLNPLISLAYQLSLYREEGRELSFVLKIADEDLTFGSEKRFEQPLPLRKELIKKLAVALDPATHCFRVAVVDDEPPFVILGFETQVVRIVHLLRDEGVEVRVTQPGCLSLSYKGKVVAFERDRLVIPDAEDRILDALSPHYEDDLVTFVSTPTRLGHNLPLSGHSVVGYDPTEWEKHKEAFVAEAHLLARRAVRNTIVSLVSELKDGRGGGTLIFPGVPFSDLSPQKLRDELINEAVFFESDKERDHRIGPLQGLIPKWNSGAIESLAWATHYQLALKDILVLEDVLKAGNTPERWSQEVAPSRINHAHRAWHEDVQAAARLGRADGAVIFNRMLEPVAVAAKLKPADQSFPPACGEFLKPRGTRHSSTASTVQRMSSGFGITISQDGDVTLFSKESGKELQFEVLNL